MSNQLPIQNYSLEKGGYRVNSSSVQLIEAMPASVDWEDVYGSMEVRSEGNGIINFRKTMFKQLRIEPAPKITCTAEHSRPAGRFLWFLGEVGSSGMIMSVRFISSISAQRHGSDK